jgi:DnaJ-class molecular chaperone
MDYDFVLFGIFYRNSKPFKICQTCRGKGYIYSRREISPLFSRDDENPFYTGGVYYNHDKEICYTCKGVGKIKATKEEVQALKALREEGESCYSCKGEGSERVEYTGYRDIMCDICNGTGTLPKGTLGRIEAENRRRRERKAKEEAEREALRQNEKERENLENLILWILLLPFGCIYLMLLVRALMAPRFFT